MTIRAIETKYAGCEFRSRLEARYAVFFDALGVAWEYEPQGYEVSWRLDGDEAATFRYLPDFWLPERGVWFEVKGEFDTAERWQFLNAAADLSSQNGDGCRGGDAPDVLLGGPLTNSGATGLPIRLHMHKGDLLASCGWCGHPSWPEYTVVADDTEGERPEAAPLLRGWYCKVHSSAPSILAAIDAARTARFEFGRKGGRKTTSNLVPFAPREVRP